MVPEPRAVSGGNGVLTASPAAMAALRQASIRSQKQSNRFWYIAANAPSSRKLLIIRRCRMSHSIGTCRFSQDMKRTR